MYGAIIGDLAGSIYEYNQVKKIKPIKINKIIEDNAFFSDDTILTIAILEAILNDKDYEKYIKIYIQKYKKYRPNFTPYFNSSFSPTLIKWSKSNIVGASQGNGAMMRISPVGYLFNNEEDIINNVRLATIPSHNSSVAIESASIIALIIFYFRKGLTLKEVYFKLKIKPCYVPFKKFNTRCDETINNCLYALYHSSSFEDALEKTILMGGDTDTNACIVGSMAEALYGISPELIQEAEHKIPTEFVKVLRKTGKTW